MVAFVVGTLSGGGAERFVSRALQGIDRTRFVPRLVLFRNLIDYTLPPDIHVYVLEKHSAPDSFGAILRLRNWLRTTRPDIVVSAWSIPSLFVGLAMIGLPTSRCPRWIARIANDPAREETGIYRLVMERLYRRAAMVVANSDGLAKGFHSHYPGFGGRARVIYNGVDFDEITRLSKESVVIESGGRPVILAVGRLFEQKRHDLLLKAFRKVRNVVDAYLVICGDGPLRDDLVELAKELGVDASVRFTGFVNNPYSWMARADVFAMTSDHEGLCNSLIEAQALGIPAVATDCRFGTSEIVDHERSGYLVGTGDVDGIARAIVALLSDPEKRRMMGQTAEQVIRRRFVHDQVIAQLESLLEEV